MVSHRVLREPRYIWDQRKHLRRRRRESKSKEAIVTKLGRAASAAEIGKTYVNHFVNI